MGVGMRVELKTDCGMQGNCAFSKKNSKRIKKDLMTKRKLLKVYPVSPSVLRNTQLGVGEGLLNRG